MILAQEGCGHAAAQESQERSRRSEPELVFVESGDNRQEQAAGEDGIGDEKRLDDARR